jgi:hypothetical protein
VNNDEMKPGRWWRVVDSNGELWCETSNEKQARDSMRPGDTLQRMYHCERTEWRNVDKKLADRPQQKPRVYVTTSQGMRGFYALTVCLIGERGDPDAHYEPLDTHPDSHRDKEGAIADAKAWAEADDLEYHE